MTQELELQDTRRQIAVQEPSEAQMLAAFIEKGITKENVEAFSTLCALRERMQDRDAKQAFAQAFGELQAELPTVAATRPVPNKDGTLRYVFAPYEEIMAIVKPLLARYGFSVSFDSKFGEGRITVTCTLLHRGGHSRENSFAVRIGGGPPGATETQADGAAKTYAKRGALCDALNIVVDRDSDANVIGETITAEEAKELEARCDKAKVDKDAFLKYAQAAGFEHIGKDRMEDIEELLVKKEIQAGVRDKLGNYLF